MKEKSGGFINRCALYNTVQSAVYARNVLFSLAFALLMTAPNRRRRRSRLVGSSFEHVTDTRKKKKVRIFPSREKNMKKDKEPPPKRPLPVKPKVIIAPKKGNSSTNNSSSAKHQSPSKTELHHNRSECSFLRLCTADSDYSGQP